MLRSSCPQSMADDSEYPYSSQPKRLLRTLGNAAVPAGWMLQSLVCDSANSVSHLTAGV